LSDDTKHTKRLLWRAFPSPRDGQDTCPSSPVQVGTQAALKDFHYISTYYR